MKKYPCPCCGYLTLDQEPPGTYDICKICFWEDDPVQFNDPTYPRGANGVSLIEAQLNYADFGVSENRFKKNVRNANSNDLRDPNWKPIRKRNP